MCLQSQILSDIGIDEFANTNLNTNANAQNVIKIQIQSKQWKWAAFGWKRKFCLTLALMNMGWLLHSSVMLYTFFFCICFQIWVLIIDFWFCSKFFPTRTRCISCNDCFVRKYLLASATPAIQLPSQLVWRFVFKCNYLSDNNTYQNSIKAFGDNVMFPDINTCFRWIKMHVIWDVMADL